MHSHKKCCLLLEDDLEDQDFFVQTLHQVSSNTGCHAVCNGQEGLLMLREEGLRPDFIFTDINMPLMDGLQFIQIIKSSDDFRHIPVIVYSSNFDIRLINKMNALGVLAFYPKSPFQILYEILRQYFGEQKKVSIL